MTETLEFERPATRTEVLAVPKGRAGPESGRGRNVVSPAPFGRPIMAGASGNGPCHLKAAGNTFGVATDG